MGKFKVHAALFLPLTLLAGCPESQPLTKGEACYFAYEDAQIDRSILCSIEIASHEPCRAAAECLCNAWDPEASAQEHETCVLAELEAQSEAPSLDTLCGPDFHISVGDVLRTYAEIQDARLTLAGPCDNLPTRYEDIELQ